MIRSPHLVNQWNIFLGHERLGSTSNLENFECHFVLWPSLVTARWVACQWKLHQTWEWAFLALWDKLIMKCLPNHGWTYDQEMAVPTKQYHLPSGSLRMKSLASAVPNLQSDDQEWGTLHSRKNWQNRLSDRYFQEKILWIQFLHLLIPRKALK